MIIIPELETVAILVPRTGTGSLYRAVIAEYPRAMMLYRHMEAGGVPMGYDTWAKVGVVRQPVDRLWSLYKFMRQQREYNHQDYVDRLRESVQRPFEDWLMHNDMPFSGPHDSSHLGRFYPHYTTQYQIAENRKSQRLYLRPDLGTEIYQFSDLTPLEYRLGVRLDRHNGTEEGPAPTLSNAAQQYVRNVFAWDLENVKCASV